MIRRFAGLALVIVLFAPTFTYAQNSSMTWKIRSYHENVVSVKFYSQSRPVEWPGESKVFSIKDYEVHNYKISCVSGEKVCYGAWVTGDPKHYWGAGRNSKHACDTCCYTCDGGTTAVRNLNQSTRR